MISYISIFKQTYAVSEILASRGKSASKHSASKGGGALPHYPLTRGPAYA